MIQGGDPTGTGRLVKFRICPFCSNCVWLCSLFSFVSNRPIFLIHLSQGRCKHLRKKLCRRNSSWTEAHRGWRAQHGKQVAIVVVRVGNLLANIIGIILAHINTRLGPLWFSLALFVQNWKGFQREAYCFFDAVVSIPKDPTNNSNAQKMCVPYDIHDTLLHNSS